MTKHYVDEVVISIDEYGRAEVTIPGQDDDEGVK